MAASTEKLIIAMYIFPNISRGKGNQIMKSGQLIEYNIINTFIEKPYTKCDRETSPRL